MATTKPKTLAELQAEREALDKQIASAELAPLESALAALNGAGAAEIEGKLEEAIAGLSEGPARQAARNVGQIFKATRNQLERALGNARARANDGATPPEGQE